MIIDEGDYIIERYRFGFHLHKAVRVTDKRVIIHRYGDREGYVDRFNIVFSGPHEASKRLLERLTSSRAQMMDDQNQAAIRNSKREEQFIASAYAAAK